MNSDMRNRLIFYQRVIMWIILEKEDGLIALTVVSFSGIDSFGDNAKRY